MDHGHTKIFAGPKQICKKYRVQSVTLRRWAERGKIEHTVTPTGRYLYNIIQVEQALGQEPKETARERICYTQVSSQKQKEDLKRQIDEFKQQYPEHTIIQDIGSGLNFKRRGFKNLVDKICSGIVEQVVIMYKDRLCRFGYELLEQICTKFQTELLVHCKDADSTEEDELSKDLLVIINVFVARNNGRRTVSNKRRRREQAKAKATESNQSKGKEEDQ